MQHTYHITWMHCPSCEILIKQGINAIPGCQVKSISHKNGTLIVEHAAQVSKDSIAQAVTDAGYALGTTPVHTPKRTTNDRVEKGARLVLALVLVFVMFKIDFTALMPAYDTISLPIALIVWLIASVSTCLALTWGIVIGYAESVQTGRNAWTQFQFHLGRVAAFIIGGAVLGMVGGTLVNTLWISTVLMVIVGIVLIYLGLQVLGFLPNIASLGMHLPQWMSAGIFRLKDARFAPLVGALTFLLPCGFTQSMQLFALQSWSAMSGALIMGAFAIGTFPVLFALGFGVKIIKDKLAILNSLLAALLIAFGVFTLYNWYSLINAITSPTPTNEQEVVVDTTTEIVAVGHNGRQFVPSTIRLTQGKNYIVRVTPTSNWIGCMQQVVLPGKGPQNIRNGETFDIVVDGTTPQKIRLVCAAMGMYQGEIVVE